MRYVGELGVEVGDELEVGGVGECGEDCADDGRLVGAGFDDFDTRGYLER